MSAAKAQKAEELSDKLAAAILSDKAKFPPSIGRRLASQYIPAGIEDSLSVDQLTDLVNSLYQLQNDSFWEGRNRLA